MSRSLWPAFKNFVSSRNLSIQWLDLIDFYYLKALDGNFSIECMLTQDGGEDVVDFETNFKSKGNMPVGSPSPFASKTLGTKRLFKRINGISQEVLIGTNEIIFSIPYNWVKITGLEVINGEALDSVSLYVLDTPGGTYSTIPNYNLNQFGVNVNVSKDYYSYKSEFDADLYKDMQIKIVYTSLSEKIIGINLILNEVK